MRGLSVQGGTVQAEVQGSRPQPYGVGVRVPPVAPAAAKRLVKALAADPGLIARLLNRDLDPAVLEQASVLGIQVFPTRWSDLDMHCSCPDWAVPCKHLAAVIYLLSQEIDGDPYLVFKLRGIDLQTLLAPQGLHLGNDAAQALPARAWAHFERAADQQAAAFDPAALERLDFSKLPHLLNALWRLVPAQPVFWGSGDFREWIRKTLGAASRRARLVLDTAAQQRDGASVPQVPNGDPRFEVDDGGELTITGLVLGDTALDSLGEAVTAIGSVPAAHLPDLSPGCHARHTLNLLALHLIAQGAVQPRQFAAGAKSVGLLWCAAELDAAVRALVDEAAPGLPDGFIRKAAARRPTPLDRAAQARVLIAGLIDLHLRELAEPRPMTGSDAKVQTLFFGEGHATFDGPGEASITGSLQAWLARLQLAHQAWLPVLRIEEAADGGPGFELSLAVANERALLDKPTPLADVIAKPAWAERRMTILQTVAMLAEFHPPLSDHVRQGAKRPLAIAPEALPPLLFDALQAMRLMGIRTLLPRGLDQLLRPRLSMQVKASTDSSPSFRQRDQLLAFDWRVALGDQMLSAAEFERLLGKARGIVSFRGEYIYLDPAEMQALQSRLSRPQPVASAELLRLKQDGALAEGGALAIVPTTLLGNWQSEAARFTPSLEVAVFHGSKRELKAERPDVLLTSYGVARTEVARLKAMRWRIVVIDEAQNIKNPAAAQAKAVKAIPAASHVAMSGTPVENRLLEYWSIMDFAQRGDLGGTSHFAREFATPIQTHRDAVAAERLRRVMAPFMLRRLKSDKTIISDLPDKLEQNPLCTLTKQQAALYRTVVREALASIAGESDAFQRQGLVLQMILALKQVCNHPAQYLKQGAADAENSGKAQRPLDLVDEIEASGGKALVFTQFREMGELLQRMLQARHGRQPLFLHGGVPRAQRDAMRWSSASRVNRVSACSCCR